MGDTIIRWATKTWNPLVGCSRVSPGCAHCYAKALHDMRHKAYHEGKDVPAQYALPFETVQLKPERLRYPLGWRKPAKIFVNSVSDLFHEDVPFDFVDEVFAVMMLADQHIYQVLTKRPERMREYITTPGRFVRVLAALQYLFDANLIPRPKERGYLRDWPFRNVWLGTSVENQHWADIRIPILVSTPAAVRFLSCEPLLGPITLRMGHISRGFPKHITRDGRAIGMPLNMHWVIVGGESGPKFRTMDPQWARDLRDQCVAAGVPFFFKQSGGARSETGKELDGQLWEQMPDGVAA